MFKWTELKRKKYFNLHYNVLTFKHIPEKHEIKMTLPIHGKLVELRKSTSRITHFVPVYQQVSAMNQNDTPLGDGINLTEPFMTS